MDFKVGDTITYYDVQTDAFASREVLFILDGWAVMRRDQPNGAGCPITVTALANAEPHREDPITPGCTVRRAYGSSTGKVIAVDGLSAWVLWEGDTTGGSVCALAEITHARLAQPAA